MAVSYKKLWKLLIATNEMAKMGKDEMVKMETLVKICKVLDCKLDDIVDMN